MRLLKKILNPVIAFISYLFRKTASSGIRRAGKLFISGQAGQRLFNKLFFMKSLFVRQLFFGQKWGVYLICLLFGLASSLGLFYFMSLLVFAGQRPKPSGDQDVRIEFLLQAPLNELELRSRRIPKKPEEEQPPPSAPKLKIQPMEMEKPELLSHLPPLELPDDFQSDSQGALVSGWRGNQDSDVTPVFRMRPVYPVRAALQNIEGFVVLKFDITETGQTDNISVIQARPPQIFNSSAVRAVRKWKYKPRMENGQAIRQKNLRVTVEFSLADN